MEPGGYTTTLLAQRAEQLQAGIEVMREAAQRWRAIGVDAGAYQGARWHTLLWLWPLFAAVGELTLWQYAYRAQVAPESALAACLVLAIVVAVGFVLLSLAGVRRLLTPLARVTIRDPLLTRLGILHGSPQCAHCSKRVRGPVAHNDRNFVRDLARMRADTLHTDAEDGRISIGIDYHPGCLCVQMAEIFSGRARAGGLQLSLTRELLKAHQSLDTELRAVESLADF